MVTLERLALSFNLIAYLLSHGGISPQAIMNSVLHPERAALQQTGSQPHSDWLDEISERRSREDTSRMCRLDSFTVEGGAPPSFPIDTALPTHIPCETEVTADGVNITFKPAHYAVKDPDKTHIYAALTPPDINTGKQMLFLSALYSESDTPNGGSLQEDLCTSGDVFFRWFITGVLQPPDPDKVMSDPVVRAACFDALGTTTTFLTTTPSGKTVKVTFGGGETNGANFLMLPVVRDPNGVQVIQVGSQTITLSQLDANIMSSLQERDPGNNFSYVLAAAGGGLTLPPIPEEAPAYIPPTPAPTPVAPEFAVVPEPTTAPDQSPPPLEPPAPEVIIPTAGELTLQMTFTPGEVAFEVADNPEMTAWLLQSAQSMDDNDQAFNDALEVARIPQKRLFNFIPYGDPYLRPVEIEGGQLSLTVYKIAYNDPAGHTVTIAGKTTDGRFVLMHFDLSDKYITSTSGTFQMYKKQNGQNLPYLTLAFTAKNADHTEGGSTLPESIQAYLEYIVNANEVMTSPTPIGYIVTPEVKGHISGVSTENEAKQILATHPTIPYVSAYVYTTGAYDRDPDLIPVVIPTGVKVAIKKWVYSEALNTWVVEVELNRLDTTRIGFQILQSNVDATGTTIPKIDQSYITFWIPEAYLAMINPPVVEAPAPQSTISPTPTVIQDASYFHPTPDPRMSAAAAGIPLPGQVLVTQYNSTTIHPPGHRHDFIMRSRPARYNQSHQANPFHKAQLARRAQLARAQACA